MSNHCVNVLSNLVASLDLEPAMTVPMPTRASRTRWGGIAGAGEIRPTGYFHVASRDGNFWLIDPDGGRFLSKGVNTVRFDQDKIQNTERIPYAEACKRKYGSRDAWRAAAAQRLSRWGFNTLGSWSDEEVASAGTAPLAVTPNIDLGISFAWQSSTQKKNQTRQEFPEVFDPAFERHVRSRARDLCAGRSKEQSILGWFIDNELRWAPDWRGSDELLTLFLDLGAWCAGRTTARAWLRERYRDFSEFNSIWRTPARTWDAFNALPQVKPPYQRKPYYQRNTADEEAADRAEPGRGAFFAACDAFAALAGERYFALTVGAIKAADPNHLVLGSRFAYVPPPGVIEAAGRFSDVISVNCYDLDASPVIKSYAATGRPSLIGEFSFRGADSGLPNTNGAGPVVANQTERAAAFRRYVTAALQQPNVVGYHWFEHADQPAEGRFDGENSNFGTVTIEDHVYEEVTQSMTSLNNEADDIHAAASAVA
jgi:hypothetical protein